MPNRKSSTTHKKKTSAPDNAFKQIFPLFHAVLFSYETALAKPCFEKAQAVIPNLMDYLDDALPDDLLKRALRKGSIEETVPLLSDFLTTSNYFGSLEFSNEGRNIYGLSVIDCEFAKTGIHKHLRTEKSVCPIALIYAAYVSRIVGNRKFATFAPSEFQENSSYTRIFLRKTEDGKPISSMASQFQLRDYPLDRLDIEILRIMQSNARMSNVEIADTLDSSEATIRRHIRTLQDDGIIMGFVAQIDHGRFKPKVRVNLALEVSPDKIDDIAKKLLSKPELCSLYRSLGQFNLICELLMDDMSSVQGVIDDISKTDGVIKTNSMVATSPLKPCPWYG